MSDDFIDVQEDFMQAIDDISYLQPELALDVADRIRNDKAFFWATGRTGEDLLMTVLERRREKGIATNIFIHGEGGTQVGKSIAAIIIAYFIDPTFTLAHLVFDFTQLERTLPETLHKTTYIVDDVRDRIGTGSKAEVINVTNFVETSARTGTSLIVCSPTLKEIPGFHYSIEMLGFCDTYSLGILYDRKKKPIAWMRFEIPDEVQPVIEEYYTMKQDYMQGIRQKSGGVGGYVSGKIEQIIQDIKDKGLTFENPKKLWRFITLDYDHWVTDVRRAAFEELKEIFFVEEDFDVYFQKTEKYDVDYDVHIPGIFEEILQITKVTGRGSRNPKRAKEWYRLFVEKGLQPGKIAEKSKVSDSLVSNTISSLDDDFGKAFEIYLEKIQPGLWKRKGGHGEPDLVSLDGSWVISVKAFRGRKKDCLLRAFERSTAEKRYVKEHGVGGLLILLRPSEESISVRAPLGE